MSMRTSVLNIQDALLLAASGGPGDFSRINWHLFAPDDWSCIHEKPSGSRLFARRPIAHRGRVLFPVLLKNPAGKVWHQPFYRSSGVCTPDSSPEGAIWPMSGVYTDMYCLKAGLPAHAAGFIGKDFFLPPEARWVPHDKDASLVPAPYHHVAAIVAEHFAGAAALDVE